ncbi:MAG TPA: glucosyl-3-phosphoglycerate synthase [Solirubrobacteraceae bacterium]|jgi:glycosyltransferase involved in cell wall biosynthesis
MELKAIVVVPARDEQDTIGGCLRALAEQTLPREDFEILVVLDDCTDGTAEVVAEQATSASLRLRTIPGPGRGAGAARRAGMEAAAAQLLSSGRPEGLIASTDADSRPAPDWLERQLAHTERGARAVAGLIELDPGDQASLPDAVLARRERDAAARLRRVRRLDPAADHHHFAGASIGITASAYREVGGLEPLTALEDAAFAARLDQHGIAIVRPADVRVRTSARPDGRAARGLSVDLDVSIWSAHRRHVTSEFAPEALAARKGHTTVTVVVPTKDCAETIDGILRRTVKPLAELGLVDELVVIDAASPDGTAEIAAAAGATVVQQDEVAVDHGPALGKGDAMWRALHVSGGDIVCFLDGDTQDPEPSHLLGLLGPILSDSSVQLVKGAFERPLQAGDRQLANEGGRVTELMARPLLNLHEPRLAGFAQPLAGEFAARRELLEAIRFPVGYGVEIAVLIDALRRHGLDALAECHLGTRQNRHQPLRALGEMAYAVLAAVERRLVGGRSVISGSYLRPWEDGAVVPVPVLERPPISSLGSRRRDELSSSAAP